MIASNVPYLEESKDFLKEKGFSIIKTLGVNNYSTIHLVSCKNSNRKFVCKVSHYNSAETKNDNKDKYLNEMMTLCKLSHPNIPQIYDYYIHNNHYYTITEYLPNGSLKDLNSRFGVVPFELSINYIKQIGSAIKYLHENKIAHLNIRPENILFDEYMCPKLINFGDSMTFESEDDTFIGTRTSLQFSSPEILTKTKCNPFKADIYAFGATIFAVSTGRPPYQGQSIEAIRRQQNSVVLDLPRECLSLRPTIRACLAFKEADRPDINTICQMLDLQSYRKTMSASVLPTLQIPKECIDEYVKIISPKSAREI